MESCGPAVKDDVICEHVDERGIDLGGDSDHVEKWSPLIGSWDWSLLSSPAPDEKPAEKQAGGGAGECTFADGGPQPQTTSFTSSVMNTADSGESRNFSGEGMPLNDGDSGGQSIQIWDFQTTSSLYHQELPETGLIFPYFSEIMKELSAPTDQEILGDTNQMNCGTLACDITTSLKDNSGHTDSDKGSPVPGTTDAAATGSWSGSSCKDSKGDKEGIQFIERLIVASNIAAEAGTKADLELLAQNRGNAMRRYMEKKNRRRYDKQIRYETRKARADTRKRVKGRFAKSIEASEN